MDLTPELLLEAKFSPARRGYDMAEVDDFLERCAEGLDVLLSRLRAEFERAERAETELRGLRGTEPGGPERVSGGPSSPPVEVAPVAEEPVAEEPVAEESAAVEVEPLPKVEHDLEEPLRVLIAAERTAEAAVAEARAEAARLTAEAEDAARLAREEAEELVARSRAEAEAEARAAGEAARRAVAEEVARLQQDRTTLDADVRALSGWLDEQRTRMLSTARDLERLARDPAALGETPEPVTPTAAAAEPDEPPGDDAPSLFGTDEPTRAVPAVGLDGPDPEGPDPDDPAGLG